MQNIRNSLLNHIRVKTYFHSKYVDSVYTLIRLMSTTSSITSDQISARVILLVQKFTNFDDATKVTETANFQKDLSLDSLDRVELVMALEQEFSIEIPDDKADNLTCCADVTNYILSETQDKLKENP